MTSPESGLQYLDPLHAAIGETPCKGMTIRGDTGTVLGELEGFLIDPVSRRLTYLIVRTTGLFGRTRLLPFGTARLDSTNHVIEVRAEESDLHRMRESFPAFTEGSLVA